MTRPGPVWSAHGLTCRPAPPALPIGVTIALAPAARLHGAHLGPESTRHLRDWLTWLLSDRGHTPPADPDRVRHEIERQRIVVRAAHYDAGDGRDAELVRTGLAWAETALKAVAIVAGEPR